jgi:mannose-6-phosphate isomerase
MSWRLGSAARSLARGSVGHSRRVSCRAIRRRPAVSLQGSGCRPTNYPDPHPKPELICALSPFSALCGFRAIPEIARAFRESQVDAFASEIESLEREGDSKALERFFSAVWNAGADRLSHAIDQAVTSAERRSEDATARWITAIAALYPGDAGVLAPMFLNLVELAPGEAMYLRAGELHSYLEGLGIEIMGNSDNEGLGIEIMGNSDNVLRGGLTEKHIDVSELCRVLCFESREAETILPSKISTGERIFETPADEFELAVCTVEEGKPWRSARSRGVEILLAIEGEVTITDGAVGEPLSMARGASVLVPHSVEYYELTGSGVVYRAGGPKD